jgi:hypothetical protein
MSPSSLTYWSPSSCARRSIGSRSDVALGGDDQRVDLRERRLLGAPGLIERAEGVRDALHDIRLGAACGGDLAGLLAHEPGERVDVPAHELPGALACDLLDLDAALHAEHHERGLRGAVEQHGGVVLGRDLRGVLDPERVHDVAADVHAEDRARVLADLGLVGGELDPAGLAAPADQHLRLDDDGVADLARGRERRLDGARRPAGRDREAVAREELLALVLEQIHDGA